MGGAELSLSLSLQREFASFRLKCRLQIHLIYIWGLYEEEFGFSVFGALDGAIFVCWWRILLSWCQSRIDCRVSPTVFCFRSDFCLLSADLVWKHLLLFSLGTVQGLIKMTSEASGFQEECIKLLLGFGQEAHKLTAVYTWVWVCQNVLKSCCTINCIVYCVCAEPVGSGSFGVKLLWMRWYRPLFLGSSWLLLYWAGFHSWDFAVNCEYKVHGQPGVSWFSLRLSVDEYGILVH